VNTYVAPFHTTNVASGGSVNTTLASSSSSNIRYGLNTSSTAGSYANVVHPIRPAAIYGGNLCIPYAFYYLQMFTINGMSYGASPDSLLFGIFNPTQSGCSVPSSYSASTSWITGINNVQYDGRWIVEVQAVSTSSIRARLITQNNNVGTGGTPSIGSWTTISGISGLGYQSRLSVLIKQASLTSVTAWIGAPTTSSSQALSLGSGFTQIGSTTSWAQQPSNITNAGISTTIVGYSGGAVNVEIERPTIILL
jgi:hypothetical protein